MEEKTRRTVLLSAIALLIILTTSTVLAVISTGWWMKGTIEVNAIGFGRKDSDIAFVKLEMTGTFYAYNKSLGVLGDLDKFVIAIDSATLTIKFLNRTKITLEVGPPYLGELMWSEDLGDTLTGSNTTRIWTIKHTNDYTLRLRFVWDNDFTQARIRGYVYGTFELPDGEVLRAVGMIRGTATRTDYGPGIEW